MNTKLVMQKTAREVVAGKRSINIFEKIRQNHSLMMIICCLVPLIIAGILLYFGFKTYALFAIMLLCPVLHYFMMKDMHKKHGNHGDNLNNKKSCH